MSRPHFEQDERTIILQRKHWIFIALRIAILGVLSLVPLFAGAVFAEMPNAVLSQQGLLLFIVGYAAWLFVLLIMAFYSWTVWVLDIWIITDRKFVDIEQRSLFNREVSTLTLEKVQDVTVKVNGFFATWLDFGTVVVQTAGQEREFVIHGIRHPYQFKEKMLCACSEHTERHAKTTPDGVASDAA